MPTKCIKSCSSDNYEHVIMNGKCMFDLTNKWSNGGLDTKCVSPVFKIFFMTVATCPLSMELSSFTMRIRHEQSTRRDRASRIRPTARSDRATFTKRCLPTVIKRSKGVQCISHTLPVNEWK
uniref:Uncharacterized protein n=1 Tax=Neogobius melanostomus TaxID=47308 RepID=A0A8C6SD89_9GOBI